MSELFQLIYSLLHRLQQLESENAEIRERNIVLRTRLSAALTVANMTDTSQ